MDKLYSALCFDNTDDSPCGRCVYDILTSDLLDILGLRSVIGMCISLLKGIDKEGYSMLADHSTVTCKGLTMSAMIPTYGNEFHEANIGACIKIFKDWKYAKELSRTERYAIQDIMSGLHMIKNTNELKMFLQSMFDLTRPEYEYNWHSS